MTDKITDKDGAYKGDLHPSIDFPRNTLGEYNFCYDCKLVSTTVGEVVENNDESTVVCPRCGGEAYVVASDEEMEENSTDD